MVRGVRPSNCTAVPPSVRCGWTPTVSTELFCRLPLTNIRQRRRFGVQCRRLVIRDLLPGGRGPLVFGTSLRQLARNYCTGSGPGKAGARHPMIFGPLFLPYGFKLGAAARRG